MRYRVNGQIVRSENAAKPASLASGYLLSWIAALPCVDSALDYGCGKLRYSSSLADRCRRLVLVDSAVQLGRSQVIHGRRTSVRDYATARWAHAVVLDLDAFSALQHRQVDFVLCSNVLSAIPSAIARSRALRSLHAVLRPGGGCLFVNQYRNSDFRRSRALLGAIPHAQGWVRPVRSGLSYYGLWPVARTVRAIQSHGFSVGSAWRHGESAYVLARR